MSEDFARWLDEQIERERRRASESTDDEDTAFYEGMVDGYKLVYQWLEGNDPAVIGVDAHDCGHICCDERHDPSHSHFLNPARCPVCASYAESA